MHIVELSNCKPFEVGVANGAAFSQPEQLPITRGDNKRCAIGHKPQTGVPPRYIDYNFYSSLQIDAVNLAANDVGHP